MADTSINADYFGEETPSYFLNRNNHYGAYTNLNVENETDSSFGVYSRRIDTSIGTTFVFKGLKSINDNLIITEENETILLTVLDSSIDASVNESLLINQVQDSSIILLEEQTNNIDSSVNALFQQNPLPIGTDWQITFDSSALFFQYKYNDQWYTQQTILATNL